MKKRIFLLLLMFILSFILFGCMGADGRLSGPSSHYVSSKAGDSTDVEVDPETGDVELKEDEEKSDFGQERSGQLTASALFDNLDYEYFKELGYQSEEGKERPFYSYQTKFKLTNNMIKLTVKNAPLAKVVLVDEDVNFTCHTDKNGVCYLFTNKDVSETSEFNVRVYKDDLNYESFTIKDNDEIELSSAIEAQDKIEICFVIDTTGSMDDEMKYLKVELKDVIEKIAQQSNNSVSLALLFYRDTDDNYLTRSFDFSTDIDKQIKKLGEQKADGGGDIPEAVQEAFKKALELSWSNENTTKILVHVADAPSHDSDVNDWFNSVNLMAEKGIRIINVASSGIDKKTEYFYRNQCVKTNGCYAFLTDDSGIGGSHLEATVKEPLPVEFLNDLLVRVITGMHTGNYASPIDYRQKNTD